MCDMTYSYVWHDSFNMCDMTHSTWASAKVKELIQYVWHDSFNMCDLTHSMCVTWLIQYVWYDSLNMCDMTHSTCVTWLIQHGRQQRWKNSFIHERTQTHEVWDTHIEWFMSHIWMSHVTHTERVMLHIWMRCETRVRISAMGWLWLVGSIKV